MLLILNSISTALFALLAFFAFSLPSLRGSVDKLIESFDLFYRVVLGFLLNATQNNYVTAGMIFLILFFVGFLSTMIIHGDFRKLTGINYILIAFTLLLYPFGTILGFLSIFFLHMYKQDT